MNTYATFSLVLLSPFVAFCDTRIEVDIGTKHQVIDSFGASDAWTIDPAIKKWQQEGREDAVEQLADMLFSETDGIGLSAWRFNIGAGSAEQGKRSGIPDSYRRAELLVSQPGDEVDRGKQTGQVRFLKEAYERDVSEFVAFVNSPPVWATKNGLAHPGDGERVGSTNLDPEKVDPFAEFLADVVLYLRSDYVGVPVNHLSPVNEPTWDWEGQTQEGNRYNVEELKEVYRSVYNSLKEESLEKVVSIDGTEAVEYSAALSDPFKRDFDDSVYRAGMNDAGFGLYRNYLDEFLGDPEMRSILGNKISLHGYFSDAHSERMGKLRDVTLQNLRSASPDAKIWMSEFCILGGPGDMRKFTGPGFDPEDMDLALHVSRVIHRDLTRLNASAWHWWLALTPYDYKDGLIKVDQDLDPESVTPSKLMWALGNYSRFIRPGYVRVGLSGADDMQGLAASAYLSADSARLVVVAVNSGLEETELRIDFSDGDAALDLELLEAYKTNQDLDLESFELSDKATVPARSVVTYLYDIR